jgi:hypothetical protein
MIFVFFHPVNPLIMDILIQTFTNQYVLKNFTPQTISELPKPKS